mmetsp:Transcript_87572/g.250921  ORF Transcript_87572/g.250921 Transcript_87572/m.250921 type:complete len:260 (+) Transcript_87572:2-781(+)
MQLAYKSRELRGRSLPPLTAPLPPPAEPLPLPLSLLPSPLPSPRPLPWPLPSPFARPLLLPFAPLPEPFRSSVAPPAIAVSRSSRTDSISSPASLSARSAVAASRARMCSTSGPDWCPFQGFAPSPRSSRRVPGHSPTMNFTFSPPGPMSLLATWNSGVSSRSTCSSRCTSGCLPFPAPFGPEVDVPPAAHELEEAAAPAFSAELFWAPRVLAAAQPAPLPSSTSSASSAQAPSQRKKACSPAPSPPPPPPPAICAPPS